MKIQVREYWPTFVERDEDRRVVYVNSPEEVLDVPWIEEKQHHGEILQIGWDSDHINGHVQIVQPDNSRFVIATLKNIP